MRRGKVLVCSEIFEDSFFDNCEIADVQFDHDRRVIIFQLHDDRFDEVKPGCEPYVYSVAHSFGGEVRFEK